MTCNFIEEYPGSISSQDCTRLITLFETSVDLQNPGYTTLGYRPENKKDTEIMIDNALFSE